MAVALLLATMLAGGAAVWLLDRGATPDATAGQPPRVEAPSGSASTTAGPGTTPAAAGTPAPTAVEPADALDPDPRSPASWRTVLDRLYDARAEAYASLSVAGLESVHTPGSSLRAADSAEITRLRRSGVQVRDFAPEVVEVRSATRRGDRVELQLVDRWPAYRVVGDDGSARVVPARRERVVAMVLLRGSDGWRIDTAGLLP
jgi:hypothetical protein